MILTTLHAERNIFSVKDERGKHHSSHVEIKPLDLGGTTFHWCWRNKSPLWGDTRLPPIRSCWGREDWEDAGGDDDAGGNRRGSLGAPQSAVGEGAEEEAAVVVGEAVVEEWGGAQAEGRTAAARTEKGQGTGMKVSGELVGYACALCLSEWRRRGQVSWKRAGTEGVAAGKLEMKAGSSWRWLGSAWARVEGEAREEGVGLWRAEWGTVSSEGPSGSDPPRPGLCRPGLWWPGGAPRENASPSAQRQESAAGRALEHKQEIFQSVIYTLISLPD